MRTHVLFLLLWSLLVIARVAESVSEFVEFRLAARKVEIFRGPPHPYSEDSQTMLARLEHKQNHLVAGRDAGVEVILLGGVCFCFFRVWRIRKESASPYIWTFRRRTDA